MCTHAEDGGSLGGCHCNHATPPSVLTDEDLVGHGEMLAIQAERIASEPVPEDFGGPLAPEEEMERQARFRAMAAEYRRTRYTQDRNGLVVPLS